MALFRSDIGLESLGRKILCFRICYIALSFSCTDCTCIMLVDMTVTYRISQTLLFSKC